MSAPRKSSTLTPGIGWDDRTQRYVGANGRFVAAADVKRHLERSISSASREIRTHTQLLREGEITLDVWQRQMLMAMRDLHTASAALAHGGWAQMDQAGWGRVGWRLRQEYAFLERFAEQLASGKVPLDGRILSRSDLYVKAARHWFERERFANHRAQGFRFERSVRHVTDSCEECVDAEARGLQPIGTLPLPGTRECLGNCACSMEYWWDVGKRFPTIQGGSDSDPESEPLSYPSPDQLEFKPTDKHGRKKRGRGSAGPNHQRGLELLRTSRRFKQTTWRRIAIDYDRESIMVFDVSQHEAVPLYHGHYQDPGELDQEIKNWLIRENLMTSTGKLRRR